MRFAHTSNFATAAEMPMPTLPLTYMLLAPLRAPASYSSLRLDRTKIHALNDYPWKLIVDQNTGARSLYHLADDPGERAARTPANDPASRAALARLSKQLVEVAALASIAPEQASVSIPEDARRTLEALGYLDSSDAEGDGSAEQP